MENISILYIRFGPKILIFVEAGPARLPLFHSPAAQLEAQRARPTGGLHPHGAEAGTEMRSSPVGEESFPEPHLQLNPLQIKTKNAWDWSLHPSRAVRGEIPI
jgi:hypothetical protein